MHGSIRAGARRPCSCGAQDFALSRGLAVLSRDLCDDGELVIFEDATHWLHPEP